MHELTIAMEILDIANDYAKRARAEDIQKSLPTPYSLLPTVKEIVIEVGELSGVEYDALDFALDISKKNTILEKAVINIQKIKGKAKCNNCNSQFSILNSQFSSSCPSCNQNDFTVIDGKQLKVKTITFD